MITALTSLLFAAALCLALGTIAASWRGYGAQLRDLRQQLGQCDVRRDLRYTVITTLVRSEDEALWKPGFNSLAGLPQHARQRPRRPLPQHFARAA